MLEINKNTEIYEAESKVNGITVMTFRAEIDKKNPQDSSLDVKKENENLYRDNRDEASADREQFEDMVFAMIDALSNPDVIDGEVREVSEEEVSEQEVTEDAEN